MTGQAPPVEVLRCPVHGIPDCSALLNGCSIPNRLAAAYALGHTRGVRGHDELAAAVDRIRARHPRGDEESGALAPGLWCPGCGQARSENGWGGCADRNALGVTPRTVDARGAG